MARLTTGPNYLLTIWKVSGILRRLKQGLRQMGIHRDMLTMRNVVHRQGCRIKRFKLTQKEALRIAPDIMTYLRIVAGDYYFAGVQVTVIDL